MNKLEAGLKKKVGPLPLWAWVVLLGGTAGLVYVYEKNSGGGGSAGVEEEAAAAGYPSEGNYSEGGGGSGSGETGGSENFETLPAVSELAEVPEYTEGPEPRLESAVEEFGEWGELFEKLGLFGKASKPKTKAGNAKKGGAKGKPGENATGSSHHGSKHANSVVKSIVSHGGVAKVTKQGKAIGINAGKKAAGPHHAAHSKKGKQAAGHKAASHRANHHAHRPSAHASKVGNGKHTGTGHNLGGHGGGGKKKRR